MIDQSLELLKSCKLSDVTIGSLIRVSPRTIHRWRTGERKISAAVAPLVAEVCWADYEGRLPDNPAAFFALSHDGNINVIRYLDGVSMKILSEHPIEYGYEWE